MFLLFLVSYLLLLVNTTWRSGVKSSVCAAPPKGPADTQTLLKVTVTQVP
jgi:hypothetical protein